MDFNKLFANRSTVRTYSKDRRVDETTIMKLLEAASHAPTTGNMQLYSVVLTMVPENIAALAELHLGQPAARNCQAMLTFCADTRRFGKWCSAGDTESGLDNISGDLMAVMDTCFFAQQFVTLAELHGLGTCYLGTVVYDLPGFRRSLELPEGVLPLFSVTVGYPEGDVPEPSDRLPIGAVVHKEKYHDPDNAAIARAYEFKESLPESSRFIAENGKSTLAQVYAEVRYPKQQNELISAELKKNLHI